MEALEKSGVRVVRNPALIGEEMANVLQRKKAKIKKRR
jgi:hypothetical protein